MIFLLPETPRWNLKAGRTHEAIETIRKTYYADEKEFTEIFEIQLLEALHCSETGLFEGFKIIWLKY